MQINLKTMTATYKKSSFISGIIVLESEGPRIEIWLSTRDLFNSRREIKPGCHLICTDKQYTILEVDHRSGNPTNLIFTLNRDFPKGRCQVYKLKRICINVNGDLQGNHLMLFTTKCQHNGQYFVGSIVTSNAGKCYLITASFFL